MANNIIIATMTVRICPIPAGATAMSGLCVGIKINVAFVVLFGTCSGLGVAVIVGEGVGEDDGVDDDIG